MSNRLLIPPSQRKLLRPNRSLLVKAPFVLRSRHTPERMGHFGLGLSSGGGFTPFSTEYTSGTDTINIPAGALTVAAECIGPGAHGVNGSRGGGGGAYAKRNTYSVSGLTAVWLTVGAANSGTDTTCRENTSGGTIIAQADSPSGATGGLTANCTGDVKNAGGNGGGSVGTGGGGAGGPSGAGSNNSGANGGAGGGSPAGAGGTSAVSPGVAYGGGGASQATNSSTISAAGWVKLTWA